MANTRFVWLASVLVALVSIGCGPSQEELDAEKAKVRELQAELQDARKRRKDLQSRLDELSAQNEELSSRLESLGQNLEEVEGERRSLEERMAELQKALEEYRKRQAQAEARQQQFCKVMGKFREMIESGQLNVRVVRNRMVVELPEGILFPSGRAKLKDEGEETLGSVADVLKQIQDRDFQIAGHTDNVPINTRRFPSNWELSTARAVNVTRYLTDEGGLSTERLSAAGYADTQPVAPNETAEGRAQNRRIEIVLVPNLDELPDLSQLEESCG